MQKPLKRKWHILFFLDYRILIKTNPLFELCPNCQARATLERLKEPTKIHKFPRIFGFRKYHCSVCKWDGHIYLYSKTNSIKKILINYLIMLSALFIFCLILMYFFDDIISVIYR